MSLSDASLARQGFKSLAGLSMQLFLKDHLDLSPADAQAVVSCTTSLLPGLDWMTVSCVVCERGGRMYSCVSFTEPSQC